MLKTTAIILVFSILSTYIYHVEVVSIPSLDGAIFSRDSLLHSNLQLCHWLLLFCPTERHKQEKQTDKLHSLERWHSLISSWKQLVHAILNTNNNIMSWESQYIAVLNIQRENFYQLNFQNWLPTKGWSVLVSWYHPACRWYLSNVEMLKWILNNWGNRCQLEFSMEF